MSALDQLRQPGNKRLAVRVKSAAERKIRQGHPWVFDGSIESISHEGAPGDLAVVFDRNRDFAAIGLYDPVSPIRIRILHAGSPRTVDADFWLDRLSAAIDLRQPIVDAGDTTGYRVINGEGDGFSGLVVDRYGDVLVAKVYSEVWFAHLSIILRQLVELSSASTVVVRLSRDIARDNRYGIADGEVVLGPAPQTPLVFTETGLKFGADVVHGQKTGHFLDQRDNRRLVGGLSVGARVLDLFCATGGFTVHAAAGGARSVVSVDQSGPTLAAVADNLALNADVEAVAAVQHRSIRGDAFAIMAGMATAGERFDIVVVDPPSFAHRNDQVEIALRSYRRLTTLALPLVNDGDWLVQASCSSRVGIDQFVEGVFESADRAGYELNDELITGHPLDHPAAVEENLYLKAVIAKVRRR